MFHTWGLNYPSGNSTDCIFYLNNVFYGKHKPSMIPEAVEKELFDNRVRQIKEKRYFDFSLDEYVAIKLTEAIQVRTIAKAKLDSVATDYVIPVLKYWWINDYGGKKWHNVVQEYLGIFRTPEHHFYLTESITVNENQISFGKFRVNMLNSLIDTKITWGDESEPYEYQLSAVKMSGIYDLSLLLAIAANCTNSWEAQGFSKFGYDHANHRSWQDSVLVANGALEKFKEQIINFVASSD